MSDMSKWCIRKSISGFWHVMPPVSPDPDWYTAGDTFHSGAEALTAFAKAGAS